MANGRAYPGEIKLDFQNGQCRVQRAEACEKLPGQIKQELSSC